MKIWFDMDGTIADLYGVENWLDYLKNEDTFPYDNAAPMLNFSLLARYLNKVQKAGHEIGIISWGARNASPMYLYDISISKFKWLEKYLPSVKFNHVKVVKYGLDKYTECGEGILFDDEEKNRNDWKETAYKPEMIFDVLKALLKEV